MSYKKKAKSTGAIIALGLVLTMFLAANTPLASSSLSSQGIDHVILIVMENDNYQNIIGSSSAPYINSLASNYATATNYYGVEYPSLPNYIDLTSGSNGGITSDCSNGPASGGCETSDSNIFSLLMSHGLTWAAYEESMPSNCDAQDGSGNPSSGVYMVHHDPIPYYTDLSSVCSLYDVPLGDVGTQAGPFFTALANDSLPNFSFITPNSCDNMHSCGVSSGDSWLSKIIPDIINSPSFSSTIVIITWDTGNCSSPCNQTKNGGGQVATIVVGPSNLVKYGKYGTFYNHYSTLATIEGIFGIGNLGRNDASATPLTAMLNLDGTSTSTSTTTSSATNSTITSTISNSSSTIESSTSSETTATNTTTSLSTTTAQTTTTTNSTTTSASNSSLTFATSSGSSTGASDLVTSTNDSSTSTTTSNSSSSSSAPAVSGSNPVVGMFSMLSPTRDPPAALGVGIYEAPLVGALGYVLLNFRRGPKYWLLSAQHPSGGRRDMFWRNRTCQSIRRPTVKRESLSGVRKSARRLFWKASKKEN